ncbi:vasopressin V2 receptor [Megalobrama amblycephala]|uniref:vasopressin V2 receptor n=1 Tax=Megalobrama amblycephala TaxID=75352 RepID=UPI002013CD17|nr:vasopressin V2 receptor [Megalobrama amblycephala]XP_048034665.1 vasopressin V2 receptor [Megalobrama amblycephala]
MEIFSREAGWERSLHATVAWSNLTTSSFSEHAELNSTFRGGSYFWLVSQNSSINPTQAPDPFRMRDTALAQAEIGILGLVLALTTLGNSFVLWVLLRRRKYNAPMHLFMVNLCVADLVVAFFQVLPQLVWVITERFQGPDVLCRSVKYLQIVGMFASSYMIVAMTVDRHNAICCPLQTYKGGAVSCWNTPIMVAWGLALVLSVPQVFIFSRSEVSPGVFECWGHFAEPWGLKAYVTWMTVAVFVVPTFIITVCQVRIFKEIHDNIYLKSERVVSADMKKNLVIFHFPIFKKRASSARLSHMQREAREPHKKNTNGGSSHSHTCNTEDAEPDCCDQSCQDGHSPNDLASQTRSSSSDVLPCIQAHPHTIWSNSGAAQTSHGYSVPHRNTTTEESNTSSNPSFPPCPLHPPLTGVSKAMSKTVRMTLVIVLVYTLCWSPFFIVQLWAAWDPNPPDQGMAFTILMLLASLNSCTNPWIYTAFSSSVSRELLALLRCRPKLPRRSSMHDHSSDINTSTTKDNQH